MTKHEFYRRLATHMERNPRHRKGQAAFNLMSDLIPDAVGPYRASSIDPFYDDSRTEAFVDACLAYPDPPKAQP